MGRSEESQHTVCLVSVNHLSRGNYQGQRSILSSACRHMPLMVRSPRMKRLCSCVAFFLWDPESAVMTPLDSMIEAPSCGLLKRVCDVNLSQEDVLQSINTLNHLIDSFPLGLVRFNTCFGERVNPVAGVMVYTRALSQIWLLMSSLEQQLWCVSVC